MPTAPDFVINATPIGESHTPFGPAATIVADGRALVVWVVPKGEQGFVAADIMGRWPNPDGSFVGDDFVINSTTQSYQFRPAVTAMTDGKVFVAWESGYGADGDGTAVRGIVLDPDATTPPSDFLMNTAVPPDETLIGPGNRAEVDLTGLSDGPVGRACRTGVWLRSGIPFTAAMTRAKPSACGYLTAQALPWARRSWSVRPVLIRSSPPPMLWNWPMAASLSAIPALKSA